MSAPAQPPVPGSEGAGAASAAGQASVRRTAWLAFAMLFLLVPFHDLLRINEQDVLVAARAFIDPSWIPNDWYLSQEIGYRILYDLLAGGLSLLLPIWAAAVAGELVTIALFAPLVAGFFREFRLPPLWSLPFTLLAVRIPSVVAGEWMVKSFEAKSLAYACVLAALLLFVRGRPLAAAALSGLACSFHVLVGGYAAATLVLAVLVVRGPFLPTIRTAAAGAALFLATGALGVLSVVGNLAGAGGVDVRRAGEIYVTLRVPHHTLPSHWVPGRWMLFGVFCLAAVLLGLRASRPGSRQRFLLVYALASLVFAAAGLAVFLAGRIDLLKFYWFRFPDVVLPFFGYLSAFALAQRLAAEGEDGAGGWRRLLRPAAALAAAGALAFAAVSFARDVTGLLRPPRPGTPFYLADLDPGLVDALGWVRAHTPPGSVVASDPLDEQVYLASGRAQFVSYKHSPQRERDILEWAERLRLMTNAGPLPSTSVGLLAALEAGSDHLDDAVLATLAEKYGVDYYVGAARVRPSRFPVVYRNGSHVVLALRGPPAQR